MVGRSTPDSRVIDSEPILDDHQAELGSTRCRPLALSMDDETFPTYDPGVVFRVPPATVGNSEGHVDYRLARASVLADYRDGILAPSEVCDAHPELVRAAREVGRPVEGDCPICERHRLVHVTYVFGPRLPKHGRCITLRGELARLAKRPGTHVAYAVEVCQACSWNHLVRRSTLESPSEPTTPESTTDSTALKGRAEAAGDGE